MIILTAHDVAIIVIMIIVVFSSINIPYCLLSVIFQRVTNLISLFIRWGSVPLHRKPKGLRLMAVVRWCLLKKVYL